MASQGSMQQHVSYPVALKVAVLGGRPTKSLDVPLCSVFLCLYLCGGLFHLVVGRLNLKAGHKFILSFLLFGFCMARIVTCALRISWACYPTNVSLGIAAMIFVGVGVILLFVINVFFAQRLLRAAHPDLGWTAPIHWTIPVLVVLVIACVIMLIVTVVQQFYTLDTNIRRIDRDVQLVAQTYFAVLAFLPIPVIALTLFLPQHPHRSSPTEPLPPSTLMRRASHVEKFGAGRWRTKVTILLTSSILLALGAWFRVGTNYKDPRPITNPAWYHSKACFYIFNFSVEILVVYMYAFLRIDQRFHIPNGAHGKGSYSPKQESDNEDTQVMETIRLGRRLTRINTEEELFGEGPSRKVSGKSVRDEETL